MGSAQQNKQAAAEDTWFQDLKERMWAKQGQQTG
jgi:hypothetical protein